MKRWILLMLLPVLLPEGLEATELKGRIVENEMGGHPLSNVAITADNGANPTVSSSYFGAKIFASFFCGQRMGRL